MIPLKTEPYYGAIFPNEWKCISLKEIIRSVNLGGNYKSGLHVTSFPLIKMGNILRGYISTDKIEYIQGTAPNEKDLLMYGDILFNTRNTPELVGKVAIWRNEFKKAYFNSNIMRIYFTEDVSTPLFINYIFNTKAFISKMKEIATGTTSVAAIYPRDLLSVTIQLPLPEEQTAIAEVLSDADCLIVSLQKLIAKKKAIKQGAMQELLTGKRRLPGFSGEWATFDILDVLEKNFGIKIGPFGSQLKKEFLHESGQYKVYGQENVYENNFGLGHRYLPYSRYMKLKSCEIIAGDFLISSMGTIGKCAVVPDQIPPGIMDSHLIRLRFNPKKLRASYVIQLFSSEIDFLKNQIFKLAVGGIMDGLSTKIVSLLQVTIPVDIEEQIAIAQVLSDMDAEIEKLGKKLSKYQKIKQGMMQELLTGRIRLIYAEPKHEQLVTNSVKKHSQKFDDAVMIAGIVNAFHSETFPLGRKKVQKLLYLMRRKEKADVSAFHKKAAGPYADSVRYNGGETIAEKSNYIAVRTNGKGTLFSRGANIGKALGYIQSWGKEASIDWLTSNFQYTRVDDLELFATVDMAICDLRKLHKPISVQTIKEFIHSTEEWRDKLDKTYFSDPNIQRAINKCREFFGEQ